MKSLNDLTRSQMHGLLLLAVQYLPAESYCCHALAWAIRNTYHVEYRDSDKIADDWLHPVLREHGISVSGQWTGEDLTLSELQDERIAFLSALADGYAPDTGEINGTE